MCLQGARATRRQWRCLLNGEDTLSYIKVFTRLLRACRGRMPQGSPRNPQTVALLELLGVPYNLDADAPVLGGIGPPAAGFGIGRVDVHKLDWESYLNPTLGLHTSAGRALQP